MNTSVNDTGPSRLGRIQALLAGLWAGLVIAVGAVAAPALFLSLERGMAGMGAGAIFSLEARVSLGLAVVSFWLERRRIRQRLMAGQGGSVMSATLLLVLGALFLTVFGQFALHPMIQAAKAGEATPLSFGALHGLSASLYWLKALLLLVMAWRLTSHDR